MLRLHSESGLSPVLVILEAVLCAREPSGVVACLIHSRNNRCLCMQVRQGTVWSTFATSESYHSLHPCMYAHTHTPRSFVKSIIPDFTSQNWLIIAKRFDNHAVVFISYKASHFLFSTATDEDNCMVVENYKFWLVKSSNRFNMSTASHILLIRSFIDVWALDLMYVCMYVCMYVTQVYSWDTTCKSSK